MKKVYFLFMGIVLLMQQSGAQRLPVSGPAVAGTNAATADGSPQNGVTVAGASQEELSKRVYRPNSVFVDAGGNIFVADQGHSTIQRFAAGSSTSTIVAGGNGSGDAANQLSGPGGIFVDAGGNLYIADDGNNRIQKWAPGAVAGVTVAGGNGSGAAADQLYRPVDVFVDAGSNVYIADYNNHRIQKWAPGASSGTTVAGGNGSGTAANQLASPNSVFGDAAGNVYVTESFSSRVQKWAPGAAEGITVAGGNGQGPAANQLDAPKAVVVDKAGNIYIADHLNRRVQKWAPGAVTGTTVAGGNGFGSAANQLAVPMDISLDAAGNIFIADQSNNRVQKWAPGAAEGITVAGASIGGAGAGQLSGPRGIFLDKAGNLYIADLGNNRVQKWTPGATQGVTVAGGNGAGSAANQITPTRVFVDAAGNIYVTDGTRVQKWAPGAASGITVAGGNGQGNAANQISNAADLSVDASGNVYVLDQGNDRIQKWAPGATEGVQVARKSDFYFPTGLFVDAAGNIYVAVTDGFYVERYAPDGTRTLLTINVFAPSGLFVDAGGNVYIAAVGSNRILKLPPGEREGIIVAGGNGAGGAANQLDFPWDVEVDAAGNIYVADEQNNRVQKFAPQGLTYRYYEGAFSALPDFNLLKPVKSGLTPNVDLGIRTAGRNDNYAFVWEGYITIPAAGNYTFETVSDDGSKLYFNSLYNAAATPTVNNDGVHAPVPAAGTVYVPAAGTYPITVTFFEKDQGETMQMYWTGPGIPRQLIPDAAFTGGTPPPPPPQSGLTYKYYEGTWNTLPDFNALTPVKTGNSANVDLGARTPGRNDNYAFVWEGYLNITTPGTYTFETVSDDGSKLYFNSLYNPCAIPTVNNDGVHAPVSATGTVNITSAGVYPIAITFFEKDGGETMHMYWTGPGIPRQMIPDAAFTQTPPPPPQNGLAYRYYEGTWNTLPDFNALTPVKTGNSANVDLGVRTPGRNDNFAFVWQGYINIPAAGNYTFETISDDGSKLYFNTLYNLSATATVNNDGLHAPVSASGTVTVPAAGVYPISITFFEKGGGEQMQVYWTGPGIARQLIPDAAFTQSPPVSQPAVVSTNRLTDPDATVAPAIISRVYPNPFLDGLSIDFYNDSPAGDVHVGIYDLKGRLLYAQHTGNVPKGHTTVKVNLVERTLPQGVYMAGLTINGVHSKMMKVVKLK